MELRTMRVSTSDITGKRKGSGSNDIFEKCRNFTRPSDLQSAGLYMYFEVFGERDGCGPPGEHVLPFVVTGHELRECGTEREA